MYLNCWDGWPTCHRSGSQKASSLPLLSCDRSASAPHPLMASDNHREDVKETQGGSRWLTILDSWLPTDNITVVDALLDELSLNDDGRNQTRRHSLIVLHHYTHLQSGSIDIAWDDACTLFGSVCISWNPVMFRNRLIYHGLVLLALICLRSRLIPA